MRIRRLCICVLACAVLLTPLGYAQAEPLENEVREQMPQPQVRGLCFQRSALLGRIIIPGSPIRPIEVEFTHR